MLVEIKKGGAVLLALLVFFLFLPRGFAAEEAAPDLGGHVEAEVNGQKVNLPTLKTDIDADVQGDLATVTLTQTFANPARKPMNATYLFPLPENAAVYAMTMQVGNERIRAVIKKKAEAQQSFEQAKEEGKAAALLTQYRPNMFTQQIANLMPGQPVKITLKYAQTVPKVDGEYELVMPLVVGPRYVPGKPLSAPLPAYPGVAGLNLPRVIEDDRVAIGIHLDGGVAVKAVHSKTHALNVTRLSERERRVSLAQGRIIDNRDFVLRYRLAGRKTEAGFLSHRDARGGFFSLLLEPPTAPAIADVTPREMVFVLDTSGSMDGPPIEASKTFMREALKKLKPGDYFRIIRFSNDASEFTSEPLAATPENIRRGLQFVESLYADGGTEMESGIHKALDVPRKDGAMRIVVFLTDGYIGQEPEVLNLLKQKMGSARLYAFGVGTSVNRYLLGEMARMGRGFVRYIDPTEDGHEAARSLARKLEAPVLTDISIDWGTLNVSDVAPQKIPDLFAGDSIRVQGKFSNPGTHRVIVYGRVNGVPSRLPVTVTVPESATPHGESLALIWAREQVAELMRAYNAPTYLEGLDIDRPGIEKRVTQLGLDFALVTDWTSFVAVSDRVVNPNPGLAQDTDVPLPMVKGITTNAYGEEQFAGAGTPEPHEWAVMLMMALLLHYHWRGRKPALAGQGSIPQ